MARMTAPRARAMLTLAGCEIGGDFHALPSARVEALRGLADEYRYTKPRNANGSRLRCFHAFLNRVAAKGSN